MLFRSLAALGAAVSGAAAELIGAHDAQPAAGPSLDALSRLALETDRSLAARR